MAGTSQMQIMNQCLITVGILCCVFQRYVPPRNECPTKLAPAVQEVKLELLFESGKIPCVASTLLEKAAP